MKSIARRQLNLQFLEDRVTPALVAGVDYVSFSSGATATIASSLLLSNDSGNGSLSILSPFGAEHGTVSVVANDQFVYTPDGSYAGSDRLYYIVNDDETQAVGTIFIGADIDEFTDYQDAVASATATYLASIQSDLADRDTQIIDLRNAAAESVQDAVDVYNSAIVSLYADYQTGEADSEATYFASEAAARETEVESVAAAKAAFEQVVGPNWVWDHPLTSTEQSAVNALNAAIDSANAATASALTTAAATRDSAIAALHGDFTAAMATAASEFDSAMAAAKADLYDAESAVRDEFYSKTADARAVWQASESSAFATYSSDINGITVGGNQIGTRPRIELPTPAPQWEGTGGVVRLVSMRGDSIHNTVANKLATGNSVAIEELIATLKGVGGYAGEVAALEARLIVVKAIEAATAAAAVPVGQATSGTFAAIMRAFFSNGWKPLFNQTTLAAMRAYQVIARNAITKFTAALGATKDPTKIANLQKDIAVQQDRLNQIAAWLTANGQTP